MWLETWLHSLASSFIMRFQLGTAENILKSIQFELLKIKYASPHQNESKAGSTHSRHEKYPSNHVESSTASH